METAAWARFASAVSDLGQFALGVASTHSTCLAQTQPNPLPLLSRCKPANTFSSCAVVPDANLYVCSCCVACNCCLLPCFSCLSCQIVDLATASKDVFIKLGTPSAATHVLTVQPGEVVEIVIQNDRAGLFGGEYASNSSLTSARNGREQHSFHLHGYHFWQVGGSAGVPCVRQDNKGCGPQH